MVRYLNRKEVRAILIWNYEEYTCELLIERDSIRYMVGYLNRKVTAVPIWESGMWTCCVEVW